MRQINITVSVAFARSRRPQSHLATVGPQHLLFCCSECPLLALSGHRLVHCTCPLLGVKRTSAPCDPVTNRNVPRVARTHANDEIRNNITRSRLLPDVAHGSWRSLVQVSGIGQGHYAAHWWGLGHRGLARPAHDLLRSITKQVNSAKSLEDWPIV